jgi:hypothetical protein
LVNKVDGLLACRTLIPKLLSFNIYQVKVLAVLCIGFHLLQWFMLLLVQSPPTLVLLVPNAVLTALTVIPLLANAISFNFKTSYLSSNANITINY